MEQSGDPPLSSPATGNQSPDGGLDSKRQKELENTALQTTLISRMDRESRTDAVGPAGNVSAEEEQRNGLCLSHRAAPSLLGSGSDAEESLSVRNVETPRVEEERTLTDHLNKRLLSSFLEKLNQNDLALPGVERLDCAVADEDSNRAAEEW
ncbi:uncharacterized protein LOC144063096 [Vanacampus margaritifer]